MTKADVLSNFDEVKVCVSYTDEEGNVLEHMPYNTEYQKLTPNYITFKGWGDTSHITESIHFPPELSEYIQYIEKQFMEDGVSLDIVSLGPDRIQTVVTKASVKIKQ